MKIAVSAMGETEQDAIDPRFGRARGFVIADTGTGAIQYSDNADNIALAQGAGIQTGQFIADQGVDVVVSGHFGPKAANVLDRAGIRMVTVPESYTVRQAIDEAVRDHQD